jgi:hypothetical protein
MAGSRQRRERRHENRRVQRHSAEDRFRTGDELICIDNLVDQAVPVCFVCVYRVRGKNELQRTALADKTQEALRSTEAANEGLRLRPAESHMRRCKTQGARHRQFEPFARCEAIHGGDHRLAEMLDQIERMPSAARERLRVDGGDRRVLGETGPGCRLRRSRSCLE